MYKLFRVFFGTCLKNPRENPKEIKRKISEPIYGVLPVKTPWETHGGIPDKSLNLF